MFTRAFRSIIRSYHYSGLHAFEAKPKNVELYINRVLAAVQRALKNSDPQRWKDVELNYHSNWRRADGKVDIASCIYVHEELEREFMIEIDDKKTLISDVPSALAIVSASHFTI